ncbi:hypothetical protein NDN08_007771 [Rhodosorus marinus]|uniref:RING-type domain-containing protein n=1 Tax=Rhodosorus marinus TaxID=101924 RepID=A0AAV8V392_9RHOD|nr:hypothetical protein NDN08_007771 [Rhodosorus marinus]
MIFVSIALFCMLAGFARKYWIKARTTTYENMSDKYEAIIEPDPLMTLESCLEEAFANYYVDEEQMMEERLCHLCMEGIEPAQKVSRLPCDHEFHYVCSEAWKIKAKSPTCPVCCSSEIADVQPVVIVV